MRRTDRLFTIIQILRDGKLHRAQEMADQLAVSVRTIYRDMDRLVASGVPVQGERGIGYRITSAITLPQLTLTPAELEALHLGLAIVAEVADPDLRSAGLSLAEKVDNLSPTAAVAEADTWKFATSPFADTLRGATHMPTLRAAIKARQKLRIIYTSMSGMITTRTVRPLLMDYWGRVWTLTVWCELRNAFRVLRIDLIETAEALPELFTDEPGKMLRDYVP